MAEDAIHMYRQVMSVDDANRQLLANLADLSNGFAIMERENACLKRERDMANRKKRRKATSQKLRTKENGEIILSVHYDDGEVEEKLFISNAKGNMQLYLLCPADCSVEGQLAVIMLEWGGDRIAVMCFLSRMRQGRYVYEQMRTTGILFNPEISNSLIYQLLADWFLQARDGAGKITSKILHGWRLDGRTAKFLDSSPLRGFHDIRDELRLRSVNFERIELTAERKQMYFSELLQFKESDTRLMIFLAPFLGLLKSLIDYYMGGQTVYVNLITVSEMPISLISSWVQVVSRDILSDGGIEQRDKERKQWLEQLSDETLILDVRSYVGESDYSRNKKQQFLAQCADMIKKQRYIPGTQKRISAALFSISAVYQTGDAINIILPDHTEIDQEKHRAFMEDKALEAVMTAVVDFVESNFTDVAQILRKSRLGELNQNVFSAVFEVLQMFFEKEGVDIMKILRVTDDFKSLFESVVASDDDVDIFIDIVRDKIHQYKALNRRYGEYEDDVIYYDSDYLYFPGCVLAAMFKNAHRGNQWKKTLVQLKEDGYLGTSSPGVLVKKLQVGGIRRDFYAVERTLFDFDGYADIVELAKEV